MKSDRLRIYVSGALTGLAATEGRSLYEAAGEVLTRLGCFVYLPHKSTDPARHPGIEPARVYEIDRREIARADLLVAFLSRPSLGVGMELELASAALVPIVAVVKKGEPVSRMALGSPAVIYGPVEFSDESTLRANLAHQAPAVIDEIRRRSRSEAPEIGARISDFRNRLGIDQRQLAALIGVAPSFVRQLEEQPTSVSNPSLAILSAVSAALHVRIATLVGDEEETPVLTSLREYAAEIGLHYDSYRDLEQAAVRGLSPTALLSPTDWERVRERRAQALAGIEQRVLLPDPDVRAQGF